MKVFILDNYDSFTFNLFHYVEGLGAEVVVKRSNDFQVDDLQQFDKLILSPGPGLPSESRGMMQTITHYFDRKPILGVCLGMQALAEHVGDQLYNLPEVKHGVQVDAKQQGESLLYNAIPSVFPVALYHSWAVQLKANSPFIPTAYSNEDVLLSFQHKELPVFGVQFHPESILTPDGKTILHNFLKE